MAEHGLRERLELREVAGIRRRRQQRRIEVQDTATIAEHDVAAHAAVDDVVALTAEDHQRQRRTLRVHDVRIAQRRVVEERTLRVENEGAVLAGGE